ncbi:metallophosphoesterase [Mangrovibacterium marinum]|nr:metallophosphoesterase [Mangrovibacterium marinum]
MNPDKIRQSTNYDFFYFVISLSVMNLFPKALIGLATILAFPLRFLRSKVYSHTVLLSGTLISFGMLLSIAHGITQGKNTLQVNQEEIWLNELPPELDQLKLVQVSDIHLGSFANARFMEHTAAAVNALEPDLLLFTGDMVNNYYQEMLGFEDALAKMTAKYGKFAIWGNHDYGDYSDWASETDKIANHQAVADKIREAGFELLQNESAQVVIGDTSIYLIGVENWGHRPFPQYADLGQSMQDVPDDAFRILLSHDPAHWADEIRYKTSIPLTLSGHTHGAQFGYKVAGITFSPMYFIQPLWAGLYQAGNQYLYVNQGLGCVGFPGRIDMNPEITVLSLRSNSAKLNR